MLLHILSFVSPIIADDPSTVERYINKISEYLGKAAGFVGDMAVKHPNDFVIAMATIVIAIFTAILATATIRLWNATADLAHFAEEQSRDMKASIATAEAANQINRENITASRRAWLVIEEVKLKHPTKFLEEGVQFGIDVTIRNIGQTPATAVWVRPEAFFLGADRKFSDAKKAFEERMRKHPGRIGITMFPQGVDEMGHIWAHGKDDIKGAISVHAASGKRWFNFMLFVAVVYQIVGDTEPHLTFMIYSKNNVEVGTAISKGEYRDLLPDAFLQGTVD